MNSTLSIRIDKKLKEDTSKELKKMGLDVSSSVKMFFKQILNTKSIPFRIRTENGFTIEQEEEMIRETNWALKHGKSYDSAEKLFDDILKN
ncbi:MAG: type II toxin-antitoxin system RelB/DinJ family antitoxin [Patescibacteria group bacterium]